MSHVVTCGPVSTNQMVPRGIFFPSPHPFHVSIGRDRRERLVLLLVVLHKAKLWVETAHARILTRRYVISIDWAPTPRAVASFQCKAQSRISRARTVEL